MSEQSWLDDLYTTVTPPLAVAVLIVWLVAVTVTLIRADDPAEAVGVGLMGFMVGLLVISGWLIWVTLAPFAAFFYGVYRLRRRCRPGERIPSKDLRAAR